MSNTEFKCILILPKSQFKNRRCIIHCQILITTFTFNHLTDAFIRRNLQMRTIKEDNKSRFQICKDVSLAFLENVLFIRFFFRWHKITNLTKMTNLQLMTNLLEMNRLQYSW